MALGYPRDDMVLGLKGQGHRVNKYIFHTNSNTAWVQIYESLLVVEIFVVSEEHLQVS